MKSLVTMFTENVKIRKMPLVLLFVALVGGVFFTSVLARNAKISELRKTADERLQLYRSTIRHALDKYGYLPYLLSQKQEIIKTVTDKSEAELVNQFLANVSEKSGSTAIFIVDRIGDTVAASNWNMATSFIGQNYGYRPYFKDAMEGKRGGFYAIGATTGIPGYFMSHPLRDRGEIVGAIVIKVDLAGLQKDWWDGGETVFVTDKNGVIFLSSSEPWKYRTTVPLTPDGLKKIRSGKQYRSAELAALKMKSGVVAGSEWIDIAGEKFLWTNVLLPDLEWRLHYLVPWQAIEERVNGVASFFLATAVLFVLGGLFVRERRLKKISQREARETEKIRNINAKLKIEIEERRKAEIDLRRTQNELVQAGKMAALGQMAAAIVHELNQPISAARMSIASCKLMLQRQQTDELDQTLTAMLEMTDRMAAITRQLKGFSRKSPLQMKKVNILQSVQSAIDLLKYTISDADCILDVETVDEPHWVIGDPLRLEQVFVNLIRNGLDAMQNQDEKKIAITTCTKDEGIEVAVADSGPGIDTDAMDRLFEPFFTTKESGGGLGLGLSISYGIMKEMNGEIRAQNGAHGGAVFTLIMRRYPEK